MAACTLPTWPAACCRRPRPPRRPRAFRLALCPPGSRASLARKAVGWPAPPACVPVAVGITGIPPTTSSGTCPPVGLVRAHSLGDHTNRKPRSTSCPTLSRHGECSMTRADTVSPRPCTCACASLATRTMPFAVSTATLEGCSILPATDGGQTCRLAPVSTAQPDNGRSARSRSRASAAALPPVASPAPVCTRSTASRTLVTEPVSRRARLRWWRCCCCSRGRCHRRCVGACVLGRPPTTFLTARTNLPGARRAPQRSTLSSCSSSRPGCPRRLSRRASRRRPRRLPQRCTRFECAPIRNI